MPRYTYRYAARETHEPVRSVADLRRLHKNWETSPYLGLFCDGVAVGSGRLMREDWDKLYVHTENVGLFSRCRRKGHGMWLYKALIEAARRIGAVRVYSSQNLNKFSRRMWRDKLSKIYDVQVIGRKCSKPCKHCDKHERYFIELKHPLKKKLDTKPKP